MFVHYDSPGAVTSGSAEHLSTEDTSLNRVIQLHKEEDEHNSNSPYVESNSGSKQDILDGQQTAKSISNHDNMRNPPIEVKVVLLGAQGQYQIYTTIYRKPYHYWLILYVTFYWFM